MSDPDPDLATVIGLLDDEVARTALESAAREPQSAADISARVDASRQTVYRRLERLREAGLVDESTRPRPDGHHETVYDATLTAVRVELTDDGFDFALERESRDRETTDVADELTKLWRNFE